MYHPHAPWKGRRVSIAFQTDQPLGAYGELAALAEGYGFDTVTLYNDLLFQPAWLPLLEVARHTTRVRLGPAAVNPFTCHPLNIAGNIALLDEASQGRAYLGIARGSWLDFLGIEPARPITTLREAIECVRRLLAQSKAPYEGKVFRLAGGDSLRWRILRADIPIVLGAWGAQTIRACIQHIAEVKVGGTANPTMINEVRAVVADAARRAGRDAESIGVVAGAVTVVDEDGAAARALARRKAALYLPVIAGLDRTLDLEPALLERINACTQVYDFDAAGRLIPDDVLRRVALAGTPGDVTEQTEALFEAGASRVEFGTPHGLSEREGLRLLGEVGRRLDTLRFADR